MCSRLCVARCCVCVFSVSHPVIIGGCFLNHMSSFIQLVDGAEFGIIALHCVMSHAMLIQTIYGTYIRWVGVSSAQHISLDHSGLPERSYSLETPCQTCLMCDGVCRNLLCSPCATVSKVHSWTWRSNHSTFL